MDRFLEPMEFIKGTALAASEEGYDLVQKSLFLDSAKNFLHTKTDFCNKLIFIKNKERLTK